MLGSAGLQSVVAQRLRSRSERSKKLRRCLPPLTLCEPLELRQLLSVSAATLYGVGQIPGNTWNYNFTLTNSHGTASTTLTETVVGRASFNGAAATEVDVTPADTSVTPSLKQYRGFGSKGDYVFYGEQAPAPNGGTATETDAPFTVEIPPSLTGGTTYSSNNTQTQTVTNSGGTVISSSTLTDSVQASLVSASPVSVTVPAGTFSAFELQTIEDKTDEGGTTTHQTTDSWFVPGLGLVKLVDTNSTNGNTSSLALVSDHVVEGDHLVFTTQPTGSAVNAPIPVVVTVEDSSNAVDASATGSIDLSLNPVKGGEGATLGGTVSATIANGVARFSGKNAPSIDVNGTYTLAADQATNGSPAQSATSNEFTVGKDTLAFAKFPPKKVDPDAPIPFTLEALNSDKKVDTDFNDQVQITFKRLSGDVNATLGGTVLGNFVNGIATFSASNAPTISGHGRYYLTMTPVTDNGSGQLEPATNAAPIKSPPISVAKLHLVFIAQPENVNIFAPITFKVALKNSSNQTVTDEDGNRVFITDVVPLTKDSPPAFQELTARLVDGVADFTGPPDLTLKETGTFKIEVAESTPDDLELLDTATATSHHFKVLGFHLAFVTQPQTTPAGQPISFSVEILNAEGDLVTTEDQNPIDITNIFSKKPSSKFNSVGRARLPVDGIATFDASANNTIDTPGTYKLVVNEVSTLATPSSDDTIVPYTKGIKSQAFEIT